MSMLRVMQLNAGSFFEPDWEHRRAEIVAWIDEVAPDVICFQEIWRSASSPSTAEWVAEHAAETWHSAFGGVTLPKKRSPDPSVEFGAAVLSRWPIDHDELHTVPLAGSGPPSARTFGVLRVATAGLDLFSVHLAANPDGTLHRQAQVVALDRLVRTVRAEPSWDSHGERRPGMPPIICGDFNAEPESDEIRFMSGFTALDGKSTYYQDAWRVSADGDPGLTQDWRSNPLSADLNVPRKRIDYIFVGDAFRRAGDAGRVLGIRRVCDEPRTGVQASDHFGLLAEIAWPDRPDSA